MSFVQLGYKFPVKHSIHSRANRVHAQMYVHQLAGDRIAMQTRVPLPKSATDVLEWLAWSV